MSVDQEKRRLQREFLFVFSSRPTPAQMAADRHEDTKGLSSHPVSSIDDYETQTARKKLISELREFGC